MFSSFHAHRKLGHDNFACIAEFSENVVDASRRECEVCGLDIRTEFIREQKVGGVDAFARKFADE